MIVKRQKGILGLLLLSLALLVGNSSCDRMLFDKLGHCPRGILVHLYAQTPCENQPTYPKQIKEVTLFAFDENGVLAGATEAKNLQLSHEAEPILLPMETDGLYQVVGWSGLSSDLFEKGTIKVGETKLTDLYATLKKEASKAVSLDGRSIWISQPKQVVAVKPITDEKSEQYVSFGLNMREVTNRIRFTIKNLRNPDEVTMRVVAKNGAYLHSGAIDKGESYIYSVSEIEKVENTIDNSHNPSGAAPRFNGSRSETFTLLSLDDFGEPRIHLEYHNDGKVHLLSSDKLDENIAALIRSVSNGAKNPQCENEFEVVVELAYCGTCSDGYEVVRIEILPWGVHSTNQVLG